MATPQIDPNTGERIQAQGAAPQIDPNTGERISAAAPPKPMGALRAGDSTPTYGNLGQDKLTRIEHGYPGESLGHQATRFVGNVGAGGLGLVLHPFQSAAAIGSSIMHPEQSARSLYQGLNTEPAETVAPMIGQTAVTAGLGKFAPKPLETIGGKMQDTGGGFVNSAAGSLKSDFKRGANPGRAYLDAGGGPAMSMDSLAAKASDLRDNVGGQLKSTYGAATKSGVKIPVKNVSSAIRGPIQDARSVVTGPGGTGDTAPIRQFGASFAPPIQKAVANGGFTPNDLWAVKQNVAKNTGWSDPTQIGMKSLRQETTGSLGGTLTDAVPEAKPLNRQYQGLTNLADRAQSRALTGSMPLTDTLTKGALASTGAALGYATHGPAGALYGIGSMALDSVPVKTGVGSGLYYGGKGVTAIGKGLRSLYR